MKKTFSVALGFLIVAICFILHACKDTTEPTQAGQSKALAQLSEHVRQSFWEIKNKKYNHVFNHWLEATLGATVFIDTNVINDIGFSSFELYRNTLYQPVVEKLYFNVKELVPALDVQEGVLELEYEDESSNFQRFHFQWNRVVLSYHAVVGDVGGCYVFDLENGEVKNESYTILELNGDLAKICDDGYDDDGHYWRYGTLNLITDSTTWEEANEH